MARRYSRRTAATAGSVVCAGVAICAASTFWFGTARTQNVRVAWPAGRSYIYALTSRTEGVDMPSAVFGGNGDVDKYRLEVDARLRATVLASSDSGSTVAWSFDAHRARFESSGSVVARYTNLVEHDLSGTYLTRNDASGRVIAFAADPRASALGSGYVRAVVGALEVSKPSESSGFGRTWNAVEDDTDGMRSSAYALSLWLDSPLTMPTARFERVATTRSPRNDSGEQGRTIVAKSLDHGLIRADGVVSNVVVSERRGVRIGEHRIASSVGTIGATLIAISRTPDLSLSTSDERRLATATSLYVEPSLAQLRAHIYRNTARKTSPALLAAKLQRMPQRGRVDAGLADALAATFFVHPQSIARFAHTLATADPDSAAFSAVALGLSQAGTAPAQHALADAMLARSNDDASFQLASALANVASPNGESIAALQTLARYDPQRFASAELSLGTAISKFERSDPKRAAHVAGGIARQLLLAKDSGTKTTLLLALGNAGDTNTLLAILPLTHARDTNVRAAAIAAVRAIPGNGPDAVLRGALDDSEELVRLAAARGFDERALTADDSGKLAATARSDASSSVRIAALLALASETEPDGRTRTALQRIATNDVDSRVRSAAKSGMQHIDAISAAEKV